MQATSGAKLVANRRHRSRCSVPGANFPRIRHRRRTGREPAARKSLGGGGLGEPKRTETKGVGVWKPSRDARRISIPPVP